MKPPPIPIATDGNVVSGAVAWRHQGRLSLTLVVKATFVLTHDGDVMATSPAQIVREDRTFDGNPTRSVEAAGELSPYLGRCDVTFVGSAHAPGGQPASAARLAIFRDGRPLVDKTIHVFGDRQGASAPRPFTRMPIVYERAFGGPGIEGNPMGSEAPNLVDPADPKRPIGFAPISRYWPARKRLVAALDRQGLEAEIAAIPEGMPWGYYQAAPPDQQIEYLRGDEWIVLDGLHPSLPRLQTRLMAARAGARIAPRSGAPEAGTDVPLVADMLSIDGDRQRCSIVWRGRYEVAGGEAELGKIAVLAGLAMPGRPIAWARIAVPRGNEAPARAPAPAASAAREGTVTIGGAESAAASVRPATPFATAQARGVEAAQGPPSTTATPWGQTAPASVPVPAPSSEGTIAVREGNAPPSVGEGTIAAPEGAASARPITPFPIAPPSPEEVPSRAATPWSSELLAPAPRSAPGEGTIGLSSANTALAVPPPLATPAPVAPVAPSPPPVAPVAPVAAAPAPPPPPAAPPPRAAPAQPSRPAPLPVDKSPEALAQRLRTAGASDADVAALLAALRPPPPPPPDEDDA